MTRKRIGCIYLLGWVVFFKIVLDKPKRLGSSHRIEGPVTRRTKYEMKTKITTAEEAARMSPFTRKGFTSIQMLCAIGDIRNDHPTLAHYLKHPEIIIGLGEGRFGPKGLLRRLTEMEAVDCGEVIEA